jgi:hypothetical protein
MNEANLNPIRSEKEAREKGRKGGIASGRKRRQKAQWKEQAQALLELSMKDPKKAGRVKSFEKLRSLEDLEKANITAGDGVMAALLANAIHGNRGSAQLLFTLAGAMDQERSTGAESESHEDDGFLDALNGTAADDWDEKGLDSDDS